VIRRGTIAFAIVLFALTAAVFPQPLPDAREISLP
jgi:hypothetical protein